MENSEDDRVQMLVCLDALSPYSFFGLLVLLRYQERWNLRLKLLPVLLGAVQKATGNKPPGTLPARAIAESKGYESKELAGAFMAFYHAIFAVEPNSEVDVADSRFLLKGCLSAGFTEAEAEQYLCASEDAVIKQRLKENTELAVKKGMFGAPTMYVSPVDKSIQGGEMMFFGSDRFEQMAFAIGKPWEGPTPLPSKL